MSKVPPADAEKQVSDDAVQPWIRDARRHGTGSLYRVFGLTVQSAIACPELPVGEGEPQVRIQVEEPREIRTEEKWFRVEEKALVLTIPGVAEFRISGSRSIGVTPDPSADERAVRLYLLGSAFGGLLHQRGVLALHGSTVADDQGAILLLGDSGAGKSTTAAALVRSGWEMVTDDVSAVETGSAGFPVVLPGYPQHKLWETSLRALDMDPGQFPRVHPEEDKRAVAVPGAFASDPRPIRAMFVIETADVPGVEWEPVRGAERFERITAHTYRAFFLGEMGLVAAHFRLATRIAAAVPLTLIRRPREGTTLAPVLAAIAECLAEERNAPRVSESVSSP